MAEPNGPAVNALAALLMQQYTLKTLHAGGDIENSLRVSQRMVNRLLVELEQQPIPDDEEWQRALDRGMGGMLIGMMQDIATAPIIDRTNLS